MTDRNTERVIDIAEIEPRVRHQIVLRLFEQLGPDDSLQLVIDHDPQRLRFLLDLQYGPGCAWSYLEQGPHVWRVRLRHAAIAAPTEAEDANAG